MSQRRWLWRGRRRECRFRRRTVSPCLLVSGGRGGGDHVRSPVRRPAGRRIRTRPRYRACAGLHPDVSFTDRTRLRAMQVPRRLHRKDRFRRPSLSLRGSLRQRSRSVEIGGSSALATSRPVAEVVVVRSIGREPDRGVRRCARWFPDQPANSCRRPDNSEKHRSCNRFARLETGIPEPEPPGAEQWDAAYEYRRRAPCAFCDVGDDRVGLQWGGGRIQPSPNARPFTPAG